MNCPKGSKGLHPVPYFTAAAGSVFLDGFQLGRHIRGAHAKSRHEGGVQVDVDFTVHSTHTGNGGNTFDGQQRLGYVVVHEP